MKTRAALALIGTLLLLGAGAARAETPSVARIDKVTGPVFVVRGSERTAAKAGDRLQEHDTIETGKGASVGVVFSDATVMSLGPDSKLVVESYAFDTKTRKGNLLAGMRRGSMAMITGELTKSQPGSVQVKTPRVIMGVRGTKFAVRVDEP